jgi:hypothetical protein
MTSGLNTFSENQWQDEKRTLVGLFKMRPLETTEQFAERVWKAWLEHQAKQPTNNRPKNRNGQQG